MRLHGYVYLKQRLKRFVLPSSGPSPYYMIILFSSGKNSCMKHKYKRSHLGMECIGGLR